MDTPEEKPPRQRGVVLLCVDDTVRDLVRFWLGEEGIPVVVVYGGLAAAEQLRDDRWRTLVTDRFLPPWPGLDSILTLKQRHPDLRIVVVEDGNPYTQNLPRVAGADATLSRPLQRARVFAALGIG